MLSGIAQVSRMASELGARVRYAQIVGHPIPAEQLTALVAAARLLQDYGSPWPYVVAEALHEFAEEIGRTPAAPGAQVAPKMSETAMSGPSRFLGAFQRGRSQQMEADA